MLPQLVLQDDPNLGRKTVVEEGISKVCSPQKFDPAYYSLTNVTVPCLINCRILNRFMDQNVFYLQKKATLRNDLNQGSANYSSEAKSGIVPVFMWLMSVEYFSHVSMEEKLKEEEYSLTPENVTKFIFQCLSKGLLEHSYADSFVYCVWPPSCCDSRAEQL